MSIKGAEKGPSDGWKGAVPMINVSNGVTV